MDENLNDKKYGCEGGGIGRRTRLRIWRLTVWGFDSPLSHQIYFLEMVYTSPVAELIH